MKIGAQHQVYNAPVELWSWSETSSTGRRVKFHLNSRDELAAFEKDKINKKRGRDPKPRLGDQYRMSIFSVTEEGKRGNHYAVIDFCFRGSAWSDKNGASLTIEVFDDQAFEFFRLLPTKDNTGDDSSGQEIWIVIAQLDEHGQLVDQAQRRIAEQERRTAPKGGGKSKRCGMICREPGFWVFLQAWLQERGYPDRIATQDDVNLVVRKMCNINSRAELDHSDEAWEYWLTEFEKPYKHEQNADAVAAN